VAGAGPLGWLRVRVEAREGDRLAVRCIDYGLALQVGREELHRLPPGVAREAEGLALCCRLAGRPGGELPRGACTLLVAGAGVLLVAGEAGESFLWNQLPEEPSRPLGGGKTEGWDPMWADSWDPANHHLAPGDRAAAVDGYTSIQPVCAFHKNRGQCYKGAYCQELHPPLRPGAVTADREEQLVAGMLAPPAPPAHPREARVLLASAVSLTEFYLVFPGGFSSRPVSDRIRCLGL
jgi:hypothetical protein